MLTATSAVCTSAASSRCLPIHHQGQTTSEMTSICTDPGSAGCSVCCAMTLSFESIASSLAHVAQWGELGFGDKQGFGEEDGAAVTYLLSGRRFADHSGNQRIDAIGGLQGRQRHRGVDVFLLRRQHGVLQDAGE